MTLIKVKKSVENAKEALDKLNEALILLKKEHDANAKTVLEDGVVKRFETLFEYCWKLLKITAEYQGAEAPGPRPAIQEAIRFGWIKDADLWALALDTRNATVHDYFDSAPDNYMSIIKQFAKEAELLLKVIEKQQK
jgi:nucleotidyltransferase substrate binding protein (TIGR01987 family)